MCLETAHLQARHTRQARRAAALTAQLDTELGRLRHCTLATFDPRRSCPDAVTWHGQVYAPAAQRRMLLAAYSLARQYEPHESLYIHGNYGSGKSHLAAAILNDQAAKGIEGRYGSALALLRLVRQGFQDRTADDRLEALMTVPLLMIDDLGTEPETAWNDASLFDLINARYLATLPTVVTSNLPLEEQRDDRIISRLTGTCHHLTLIAYDHRRLTHEAVA